MNTADLTVRRIADRFHLENLTPGLDLEQVFVRQSDINRPALQLTGFYDHFDHERVQIIGYVEHAYLETKSRQERREIFAKLFSKKIPCMIICRGLSLEGEEEILADAEKEGVPVLRTHRSTSGFNADLIRFLGGELAPSLEMHGVLVDVFGEGVLMTGESGIGKSETALELIQRGHRLVADDIVIIRKISDVELVGRSPELLRNLIELRGIGILDVKELYGVQSIKTEQTIDMIIDMQAWTKEQDYHRTGLEEETAEILKNKVPVYSIPIRPGRNTAIIVESAAINHRQKQLGHNATLELKSRIEETIKKK